MIQREFKRFEEEIAKQYDNETKGLKVSIDYMSKKFEEQRNLYDSCMAKNKNI